MTAPSSVRKRLILIALVAIFAAPPAVSWYLFRFTDVGRDGAGHGVLIQPPRLLPDMALVDGTGGGAGRLHGRWTLLYLDSGPCASGCAEALYRMRQVRAATGAKAERVQRVLYFPVGGSPGTLAADWPGQLFVAGPDAGFTVLENFSMNAGDDPLAAGRLYLVDPQGFLMMSYAPQADPRGIVADLKRLLRRSG